MKNLLVTGGCGFIGSNLINYLLKVHPNIRIINLDKLDYCSNQKNILPEYSQDSLRYLLIPGTVCDPSIVTNILEIYQIDQILHLAAQSHVDNSFSNSLQFTQDNIVGTHNLLECAKRYHLKTNNLQTFIHMSTDEVYGDSTLKSENRILNPTNPYAATKASCELLVESYAKSFKLPTIIVRSNNVFGPRQYHEKLIPKFIKLLLNDKPLTIQGSGQQSRTFVFTEDVSRAINLVLTTGTIHQVYEIGTENEYTVLEIANLLHQLIKPDQPLTTLPIKDRDFNDFRYQVNPSKLINLGWKQPSKEDFLADLKTTVDWYKENQEHYNDFHHL